MIIALPALKRRITGKDLLANVTVIVEGEITDAQEEFVGALAAVLGEVGGSETEARTFLHSFLFSGDEVFVPTESLSYGQRARLMLALLVARGCNLLILDEPVNHLDVRNQLETMSLLREITQDLNLLTITVLHDLTFFQQPAISRNCCLG